MLAYGEAFLGRNDQNMVLRRSRDNDITTAVEVDVGDVPTGRPSVLISKAHLPTFDDWSLIRN